MLLIKRHFYTGCAALFLSGLSAPAQVALSLAVQPSKAILCETVTASIIIRNNSGLALIFGARDSSAAFRFDIERERNKQLAALTNAPLLVDVALVPGETRQIELELSRLYDLRATGLYTLKAIVDLDGVAYASSKVYLEIVKGFELQRVQAGIPGKAKVMRTYILQYQQKDGGEDLFLRIEDENEQVIYGVFNLGQVVRVREPSLQVDEAGNMHVFFQTKGMIFTHAVFTPYGVPLANENFADAKGRIGLKQQPNGQVVVVREAAAEKAGAGSVPAPGAPAADKQKRRGLIQWP